jgi:hypothetical protein
MSIVTAPSGRRRGTAIASPPFASLIAYAPAGTDRPPESAAGASSTTAIAER